MFITSVDVNGRVSLPPPAAFLESLADLTKKTARRRRGRDASTLAQVRKRGLSRHRAGVTHAALADLVQHLPGAALGPHFVNSFDSIGHASSASLQRANSPVHCETSGNVG